MSEANASSSVGTVDGGADLTTDAGVQVAYLSPRCDVTSLSLGSGATIRSGSVLYAGTTIGDGFNAGHNVVIREECEIGDGVSVWSNSIVDYGCTIGNGVKIHSNCYVAQFTVLEDDVFLAPGVSIANDLYPGDDESAAVMAGPVIEKGAQIGVGTTILPYVRIGPGAIIGSGSVVTRDIPGGVVAYGNPARVASSVDELVAIDDRVPADLDRRRRT